MDEEKKDSKVEEESKESAKEEPKEETKESEPVKEEPVKSEPEPKKVHVRETSDKNDLSKKVISPWMISTFVLAVVVIVLLVGDFGATGGVIGTKVSPDDAGQAVLDFANSRGANAELGDVTDDGTFYKVMLTVQGQDVPVYVTKDGQYFTSSLVPLTTQDTDDDSTRPSATEVPKADVPVVELFIMTHCPYGTQAEKGFIPAIETLGDTIDADIKFVHYFMHEPEETETPIQVCIREEQPDKFIPYLKCFLEDGDSDRCLLEAGVKQDLMRECIANGNSDTYYEADSTLSEDYGVRGSPTLVINGVQASSGRDSASYLETICESFNEAPEACAEELSSDSPSPGFGYSVSTTGATDAQC